MRHLVFADGRSESSRASLAGAIVEVRIQSAPRESVTFTVESTDSPDELARYRSERGVLVTAWVR